MRIPKGVKIGDDVWIYAGAKVLGEIEIGSDIIIGSNTVVTKSIENINFEVGNPNKIFVPDEKI